MKHSDWFKMMMQAGVPRLLKAFNKIKSKRTRREMVKLFEKIAGVKPTRRKRRSK